MICTIYHLQSGKRYFQLSEGNILFCKDSFLLSLNYTYTNSTNMKALISGEDELATVGIWFGQPLADVNSYMQTLDQYEVMNPLADATGKGGYVVVRPNDLLISGFITNQPILGPIVAGIIGLIPNCAASVIITELYLPNTLEHLGNMGPLEIKEFYVPKKDALYIKDTFENEVYRE